MLKKILYVEDNKIMQNISQRIFAEADFAEEVIPAFNGREAIDYCHELANSLDENSEPENEPELIFLDLRMPVMDGWEFLDEYEKHFPDKLTETKIVVLTSAVSDQERERAIRHSVVIDYLQKPITFENLHDLQGKLE